MVDVIYDMISSYTLNTRHIASHSGMSKSDRDMDMTRNINLYHLSNVLWWGIYQYHTPPTFLPCTRPYYLVQSGSIIWPVLFYTPGTTGTWYLLYSTWYQYTTYRLLNLWYILAGVTRLPRWSAWYSSRNQDAVRRSCSLPTTVDSTRIQVVV